MNLPETFIERTKAILGNEWTAFEQALRETPPTSIRYNPAKADLSVNTSLEPVPWAANAYYLPERPRFISDPLFHAGHYYVQEASSMYLGQIIGRHIQQSARALDLCAAPGGKSTQLSSLLPEGSLLVANEVIRSRANILAENLTKWGSPNTIVTCNDPKELGRLGGFFDLIVADVPCSGEGMFRKTPEAVNEWSPGNVKLCAERQRRIIADIWPALKPGGILAYSTCTYNREENEENIAWICQELGAETLGEPRRFLPHHDRGEGFFIAALRKTGETEASSSRKDKTPPPAKSKFPAVESWLISPDQFIFLEEKGQIIAIPKAHYADLLILKKQSFILTAGINLGEVKGKDIIPAHAMAMSTALRKEAFPHWEVDHSTALQYLRKEALQNIPADLPRGFVLITYKNAPLGFVKNIGNRANNLYPQEWRIRTNRD